MDNSKIWQEELRYSCGIGVASVNVFTGRLLFEHNGIQMGDGNFETNINQIYNSHSHPILLGEINSPTNNFAPMSGRRWKQNVQQFLFRHITGEWYYIDANGMTHYFRSLGDGRFFDTSGLGLILDPTVHTVGTGHAAFRVRTITDESGNRMHFGAGIFGNETLAGYLARVDTIAGDNIVTKTYRMDTRASDLVSDSRNNHSLIHVEYDNPRMPFFIDGLLMVGARAESERLNFVYDNGNLVGTSLTIGIGAAARTKNRATFGYNTEGLLEWIIDAEDLSCIKVEYNGNRVSAVSTGVLCKSAEPVPNIQVPITGQVVAGDNVIVGGRKPTDINLDGAEYNIRIINRETFVYSERHTGVTNNSNVTLQYHHRGWDGEPVAVTELVASDTINTVSPNPDAGIRLDPATVISNSFDSTTIYNNPASGWETPILSVSRNGQSSHRDNVPLDELNQGRERRRKYRLTAWVRLPSELIGGAPVIIANFAYANGAHTAAAAPIDTFVRDDWQYIGGDFWLETEEVVGYTVHIMISQTQGVRVANMRAERAGSVMYIQGQDMAADIESLRRIALSNGTEIPLSTERFGSQTDFVTGADILRTLRSMESGSPFVVTLRDGRRRIGGVNSVEYEVGGVRYELRANGKLTAADGVAEYAQNLFVQSHIGESETVRALPVYSGEKLSIVRYGIRDGLVVSADMQVRASDGRALYVRDEYGVEREWMYDGWGNLEREEIRGGGAVMRKDWRWNTQDARLREHMTGETNALGNIVEYEVGVHRREREERNARGSMEKRLTIGDFGDRIEEEAIRVREGAGWNKSSLVEFGYEEGRVIGVRSRDGSGEERNSYELGYDERGRVSRVMDSGAELVTRQTVDGGTDRLAQVRERYANKRGHESNVWTWDRYNRLSETGGPRAVGSNNAMQESARIIRRDRSQINWTVLTGSSAAKVRRIDDHFGASVHEVQYDRADKGMVRYRESLVGDEGHFVEWSVPDALWDLPSGVGESDKRVDVRRRIDMELGEGERTAEVYDRDKILSPRLTHIVYRSETTSRVIAYEYDGLGRVTAKRAAGVEYRYGYIESGGVSRGVLGSLSIAVVGSVDVEGEEILAESYGYDADGNLTHINGEARYKYDGLGRLRSNSYDRAGNIVRIGGRELEYAGNRLVLVREGEREERISYDEAGKPVEYLGGEMEWRGRRLVRYKTGSGREVEYGYNAGGERVSKRVDGQERRYYLEGSKILGEKGADGQVEMVYEYDESGVSGIHSGGYYGVVRDGMGSVVALYGNTVFGGLVKVAEYRYNEAGEVMRVRAWSLSNGRELVGEIPAEHIAVRNPWRWKSQYYDIETQLYYISTPNGGRYYDPRLGRWISPDGWGERVSNAHESAYVAWGNNFVGAPSNQESYHCYLPIQPDIGKTLRMGWLQRRLAPVHNWWSGLPSWVRWTIGGVAIAGTIALAAVTFGASLKVKGSVLATGSSALVGKGTTTLAASHSLAFGTMATTWVSAVAGGGFSGFTRDGWCWDSASSGFALGAVGGTIMGAAGGKLGLGGNFALGAGINAGQQALHSGDINVGQMLIAGTFASVGSLIPTGVAGMGGMVVHRGGLLAGMGLNLIEELIHFGLGWR